MSILESPAFRAASTCRSRLASFLVGLLMLGAVGPASAAVIVYTSRAAWEAAVGNSFVTEDFSGVTAGPLSAGVHSAGLINITITGSVDGNAIDGCLGGASGLCYVGEISTIAPAGTSSLGFFPAPVIGFGADWQDTTSASHLTLTIGSETIQFDEHLIGDFGDGFLGFVADSPFSTVTFGIEGSSNEAFYMDNLSFSAAAAPAPGTLALIAAGLLGLSRRRR